VLFLSGIDKDNSKHKRTALAGCARQCPKEKHSHTHSTGIDIIHKRRGSSSCCCGRSTADLLALLVVQLTQKLLALLVVLLLLLLLGVLLLLLCRVQGACGGPAAFRQWR
jgi:hypothetical protein